MPLPGRDVGRVLEMPYGQVDKLCKLVPQNPAAPVTLAKAIEGEPKLQAERDAPIVREHAVQLEAEPDAIAGACTQRRQRVEGYLDAHEILRVAKSHADGHATV